MKKKVLLVASLTFICSFFNSCSDKIGIDNHTIPNDVIQRNVLDSIKLSWKAVLLSNNIHSKLNSYKVMEGNDKKSKKTYYYLIGKSGNDLVKVATLLQIVNKKFIPFTNPKYPLAICYGCKDCYPIFSYDFSAWNCESNSDDCKKIEVMSLN